MRRLAAFDSLFRACGGKPRIEVGVSDGVRTRDRWSHNPELYQLSYAHHIKTGANNSTIQMRAPLFLQNRVQSEVRVMLSWGIQPWERRRLGGKQ